MANKNTRISLSKVREIFQKGAQDFAGDEDAVSSAVDEIINRYTTSIVRAALGIREDGFSRMEFARDSPLHKMISEKALNAAREQLAHETTITPKLSEKGLSQLRAEYAETYYSTLSELVREAGKAAAEKEVAAFIKRLTCEPITIILDEDDLDNDDASEDETELDELDEFFEKPQKKAKRKR